LRPCLKKEKKKNPTSSTGKPVLHRTFILMHGTLPSRVRAPLLHKGTTKFFKDLMAKIKLLNLNQFFSFLRGWGRR
jgi:hypothetical protein